MVQRILFADNVIGIATRSGHGNIGTGNDQHLVIGYESPYNYKALIRFAQDWTDVKQITSAYIVLRTKDRTSHIGTSAGSVKASMLASGTLQGPTGSGGESYNFDDGDWDDQPIVNTNYVSPSATIATAEGGVTRINVTKAMGVMAPKTVKRADGTAGGAASNRAFQIERVTSGRLIAGSDIHPDVTSHVSLELNYTAVPAPGTMTQDGPTSPITQIEGEFFSGDFSAGRLGDHMQQLQIEVYKTGGTSTLWTHDQPASASEAATDHYEVPVPALLKSGTSYEWRVRSQNQRGEWTAWTAKTPLVVTTEAPTITSVTPSGGTFATLDNIYFGGHYADANDNPLSSYRIQVRSDTVPSDPDWGSVEMLWDTDDVSASQTESNPSGSGLLTTPSGYLPLANGGIIQRLYGGAPLAPGTYDFRVRATDSLGATSDWVYGTFILTVGYDPDPGSSPDDNLTGYAQRQVKSRIIIRGMGASRGPGDVLAIIEDAANLGGSEMYNDSGEVYFTLPAIHSQVAVIEPWQVHYAVEVFKGQGWKEMTAGLIVDFDATEDDVVFYGIDYLGVLNTETDERFNPTTNADAAAGIYPAAAGGAKYVAQTIRNIVYDQLQRARTAPNSKVAFISVSLANIATMSEKVSIFATFKQRGAFIAGLLDSHKAGTGKRTRIAVRKTITGSYEWRVEDNPGFDRDNIRLEYGGLVQGFRAVPYGEFGTRVNAIGRQFNGLKVEYYVANTPPPTGQPAAYNETIYGRTSKSNLWQDITDRNDLIRRAKQYAKTLGKIGKSMAIALRVDALGVKDGWDICDSIPIEIKRGVVDTTRFGSGYWTIWGWEWRVFPDGHTELTLSLLPREDSVAASTDLIESKPINVADEWQIGWTPPPPDADALHWVDQTTGIVYDLVGGDLIVSGATGDV